MSSCDARSDLVGGVYVLADLVGVDGGVKSFVAVAVTAADGTRSLG